jgi:2-alkyl-3-oxoalkanoate reductase
VLAAEHPAAAGGTFVMGDDAEITWAEFFGAFARALGAPAPGPKLPWAPAHVAALLVEGLWGLLRIERPPPLTRYRVGLLRHDFHFVSARAQATLGYAPRIGWEEGIVRTATWCRQVLEHRTG